jgi:hypothetical protein
MAPSRRRLLPFATLALSLAVACSDPELEHQHPVAESPIASVIQVGGLTYEREVVDPQSPFNPWMKNIGKLNNDDLPDLLVASGEGSVVWYQAPNWTRRTIGSAASESGSDVGDIDGDGDIDVVVGRTWFENNGGAGSWTAHSLPNASGSTHDIVLADVNNDGKLDIAMRGQSQSVVSVYLQNTPDNWTVFDVEPGLGLNGLDVADVNGDGRRDIVVGGVWMENPGGSIATANWDQHVFAPNWNSYASVKVSDIDNDGRPDIVLSVSEDAGDLAWFKAPADPENGTWQRNTVATGLNKVHCFAVVDINHDGQLDIAASEFEGAGRLIVYLRTGGGWTANELGRDALHNMRAGDIDNDGDIDLFGAYCFGTVPVILYRNLENGGTPGSAPPTVATAAAASPSAVTGTSTALSVLGADDNGEPSLSYTWATTGSPPGSVSFTPNGGNSANASTATFSRAGSYTLQATIRDAEGQLVVSTVNVTVNQSFTSVTVSPGSATVAAGGTQAFTASARDQFAQAMSAQPGISWSVSGGGTITSSGVFTAGGTSGGPFTVTATNGSNSGTASVTVSATGPTTTFGETSVTSTDDGNNSGLLVAQQATVTQGGTVQTLSFYVTQAAGKLRLGLYRANGPNGGPGTKLAETAELTPVAGWNTAAVTTQVNLTAGSYWLAYLTNSNSLRFRHATSGSGKWYSVSYGTMPATYATNPQGGAYHWSFYGTVGTGGGPTNQAPTVATAAAAAPSPVTANSTSLTVLGADDAGESGLSYSWSTTGSPPAAVGFSVNGSNAAKTTTATFTRAGSYTFLVTITDAQGLSTTSSVSVTVNQTLASIAVAPGSASVAAGGTQSFAATARDQFSQAMSATVSWSVSGGGTINGSGVFTAGATAGGPFTVTATSGARSGTASVTVTGGGPVNQAPTVATAAAASPSTVTDSATSLSALGADDGGEANLRYTWATTGSPPASVFFNANGTNAAKNVMAVFSRAGSYSLRVTITDAQGLSTTSAVAVTVNQTLTSLAISPTSASVATGASQTFVATGRDQFNQAMPVTPSWVVSGGGTISSGGVFTAGATAGGPFTITATSGTRSGTAGVTVTAGSATSTIGETTVLAEGDGNNGGLIVAQQVTLAQAKNAVSMSFYVTQAAGNLRLGIYRADGSGGGPGTKVAETAEFVPTTGWNTRNVVSSVSLPAGTYWLAYMPSSGSLRFSMARNGSGTWANQSYGAMPATFPTGRSSGAFHWSFYATVQ